MTRHSVRDPKRRRGQLVREHNDAREIKMILLEYHFVEEVEPEVEAQVREDGKHHHIVDV